MWKSPIEMQINPPVVFTFTRQRWSSTTFNLLLPFAVWASNTYFTPGCSYPFSLAATIQCTPLPAVLQIRDVYPGSRILILTHSGSRIQKQQQKKGVKKNCCQTFFNFFVATNFTKLKIILFVKCWRKKIWASFQRIIELFTQKFVTKL